MYNQEGQLLSVASLDKVNNGNELLIRGEVPDNEAKLMVLDEKMRPVMNAVLNIWR